MPNVVWGFALLAVVLTASALLSGIVGRIPLSFPMIFLGLGLLLGPGGLHVIEMDAHNPILEVVAIVSLTLVLFLDAVKMQVAEIRRDWLVPFLALVPGTLLTILGVALAAFLILGVTPLQSLLLGAILASTDPVVLRDVVSNVRIPRSIRRALGIEAGMNDIIVLPVVLVLIAVLGTQTRDMVAWARFFGELLVLSPLVGLTIGGVGAWLIGRADERFSISRSYQALYGIGLVLLAYAAGEAVQGDGFIATFFAGLAVTLSNATLCSCFLEYGETSAEMAMLLAFILFGVVLSGLLGTAPVVAALAFAAVVIALVRPLAFGLVLQRARLSAAARLFIGWFGPRGLSSLLLVLLAVQANLPQAEYLLIITGIVVLVSVVAHGVTATPVSAWYGRQIAEASTERAEQRTSRVEDIFVSEIADVPQP